MERKRLVLSIEDVHDHLDYLKRDYVLNFLLSVVLGGLALLSYFLLGIDFPGFLLLLGWSTYSLSSAISLRRFYNFIDRNTRKVIRK